MKSVVISRRKLIPTPGTNYKFAWKWLYDVEVPGEPHAFTGEGLGWARSVAKRYAAGRPIVETWKSVRKAMS